MLKIVMNSIPLSGKDTNIEFYSDDTIVTVRQQVALAVGSHPDRLFIEAKTKLPGDHYSTDPRKWSSLFLRLSFDGERITSDRLRTYLEQIRPGTGINYRDVTRDEWESHPEDLQPLFHSEQPFEEWRILGVEESNSVVLPLPPVDLNELKSARIPLPQNNELYETFHKEVTEIRATEIPKNSSQLVLSVYAPFFTSETPANIEPLRNQIEGSKNLLTNILKLDVPSHKNLSIIKAKWFVPFVETKFTAPHTRFEQIFYGMTVSENTPYIGYFTAKDETVRHKFYVKDPKNKKPILDVSMWRTWTSTTQPQRKLPTLLLYRGTDRNSFDRIAITSRDVTFSIIRPKGNTQTLEQIRKYMEDWLMTLDALIPFVKLNDFLPNRWDLGDLSATATYDKEVRELDDRRFGCLQNFFSIQGNTFRLLRAGSSSVLSPQDLQAFQILSDESVDPSADLLVEQMNIDRQTANEIIERFNQLVEERFNFEKDIKEYPIITFGPKDVTIQFVSDLNRVIRYADILRYIMTPDADSTELNNVCPRRAEAVTAVSQVPITTTTVVEETKPGEDEDILDLFGGGPKKTIKVDDSKKGTYNYYNERLQKFDPVLFDKSLYPQKCDKPKQVIVLTPADIERIRNEKGEEYTYEDKPESEKFPLPIEGSTGEGTAICPEYWCMRDEIPLSKDQLITEGNELVCPVCKGKIRSDENQSPTEYPVMARDEVARFPDLMKIKNSDKKFPCCYKTPRKQSQVIAPTPTDDTYILSVAKLPALRMGYLPDDLLTKIDLKTNYSTSVNNNRLVAGKTDVFRLGVGRPSKTFPTLLKGSAVLSPKEAVDKVKLCSFYRTWNDLGNGNTLEERIIDGIDRAFNNGSMSVLDEIEYVTTFIKGSVMRLDLKTNNLICGFWSDTIEPSSRTIMLLERDEDIDILAMVSRRKEKRGQKFDYQVDITKLPFSKAGITNLLTEYSKACSTNVPSYDDAVNELQLVNETNYQVIQDPFNRVQALFVPNKIILPFRPVTLKSISGVTELPGYSSIPAEQLPTGSQVRAFMENAKHSGYKIVSDLQNVQGQVVELQLISGFRVPIQPEEATVKENAQEVTETIRMKDEASLTTGQINKEDLKTAREVLYSSEIYEFLLYTLSKDIQKTENEEKRKAKISKDIQTSEYEELRNAIVSKDKELKKKIKKWLAAEAYWDESTTPPEFVNKVRRPCGQLTQKDVCNKSSLCGWTKNTCKVRVKPIVSKEIILNRITKTLLENDKQRALVLDERLSPFFSTVLYLEMPNELITNDTTGLL